jgi:Beta-L-arabinofuranosidase, GH127
MNRREFVERGLAGLASVWAANNLAHARMPSRPALTGMKIPYVRESSPEFHVPPYRGEWYEDIVPDTLDLTERLRLAVHASTSIADPTADGEVFWSVDFLRNPPAMSHDFNDWVLQLEGLLEGVPLGRTACGSTENEDVDHAWMENWVLKSLGPDGLLYVPMGGRPWGRTALLMPGQRAFRADGSSVPADDPSISQIGSAYTCQRVIPAMTLYYLRDQNPMWKAAIEKMINRLTELAVNREDYAFWPDGVLEPNSNYGTNLQMPTGNACIEWGGNGRIIQALAQYYLVTGYEPAIQLAAKLNRYIRLHAEYYTPEGAWLISDLDKGWLDKSFDVKTLKQGGHGHAHAVGLLSVLEYGLAAHDREAIAFARGGFEWGRANGTTLTGFFPEFYVPGYRTCETDTISDMLGLAVKMSVAGVADYWDDVDRWVRNQFTEQQLTSTDWVYKAAERSPRKALKPNETGDKVPERNLGAFAGWASPNDFTHRYQGSEASIMHCCMGNGTRAMYYVWEHILSYDKGELRVNLLLNRASPWAEIYSHIPYQGKVEVKVKRSCRELLMRVPEWIESGSAQVKATRSGNPVSLTWEGRYVRVGYVNPGDTVVLSFPIEIQTVKQTIAGTAYTLEIKGNTVVSIFPGGENGPLYKREYMKANDAPVTKVKRFVAEQALVW